MVCAAALTSNRTSTPSKGETLMRFLPRTARTVTSATAVASLLTLGTACSIQDSPEPAKDSQSSNTNTDGGQDNTGEQNAEGGQNGNPTAPPADTNDETTAKILEAIYERDGYTVSKLMKGGYVTSTVDIGLSSNVCDLSDKTRLTITKAPGWKEGPYLSAVTYGKTADGPFGPLPDTIDTSRLYNAAPDGNPIDKWEWHCSEGGNVKDDPAGFYRLQFVSGPPHLGQASETVTWETRR